ncbi:unnamed protein product [Linum trigynum]|uniref:Integrase catalytic domain-containing protein n=1 Tax=Linum trigynum TaxID=586398 RepID=A0AAV2FNW4_9ROSI
MSTQEAPVDGFVADEVETEDDIASANDATLPRTPQGVNPRHQMDAFVPPVIPRYEDPYLNPYYLPPHDGGLTTIISMKLTDQNYNLWSQVMELALRTKNKLQFVNGLIPVPQVGDPIWQSWHRCDSTVRCWIYNSLSDDIANSVVPYKVAKDVWDNLKDRFSQADNMRVYELNEQIRKCVQGNLTVTQYYTALTTKWQEYKMYRPVSCCPCPNSPFFTIQKYQEHDLIIKFMQGLNDVFQSARTQVLMNAQLPPIESVFKQMVQLERQLKGLQSEKGRVESVALLAGQQPKQQKGAQGSRNPRDYKDGKKWCRFCKKEYHTIDECYKLKNKQIRDGEGSFAGSVETNLPEGDGSHSTAHEGGKGEGDLLSLFTPNQFEQLRTLLNRSSASPSPPTSPGVKHSAAVAVRGSQSGQKPAGSPSVSTQHPHYASHSSGKQVLSSVVEPTRSTAWVLDTGATDHIICDKSFFMKHKPLNQVFVNLPNGQQVQATHIGIVTLPCGLFITQVLFVPSFAYNLVSVSKLTKNHPVSLTFKSNFCVIQDLITRRRIGLAQVDRGLYLFNEFKGQQFGVSKDSQKFAAAVFNFQSQDFNIWHARLGHPSLSRLKVVKQTCNEVSLPLTQHCETCHLAKQKRLPFPVSTSVSSHVFELIHVDIWGPLNTVSRDGFSYFLTIVDDHSRAVWVFLLKSKADARPTLQSFCLMVKNQFSVSVKTIRTDQGQEFHMTEFYSAHGIVHEMSCVYTAQQNGRVERKHQHLLNVARSLKFQSGLPLIFWGDFVLHAAYLINRTPTPILNHKTPFEVLHKVPPDYMTLRVFGCLAYATAVEGHKLKFDPRSNQCVFLGFPHGIKGYKLLDLNTNKVFVNRDVVFHEHILPYKTGKSVHESTEVFPPATSVPVSPFCPGESSCSDSSPTIEPDLTGYSSPSVKTTPLNPSPPVQSPSSPVQSATNTDDSDNISILSDSSPPPVPSSPPPVVPLRKSTRQTTFPKKFNDFYVGLNQVSYDPKITIPPDLAHLSPEQQHFAMILAAAFEPSCYAEAAQDFRWNEAMIEELKALFDNDTWDITDLPGGVKAIGCRWVFRIKYNPDGSIERFKARLVAKGYTQIYGIDYCDTFSPVAKLTSVKMLLAVASVNSWHLHQMDVNNAFLNGELEEDVYMELPEGLRNKPEYKGKVCKLKKSLYGLKQASRMWYAKLTDSLLANGFRQSKSDYSIFLTDIRGHLVVLIVYVGDIVVGSEDLDAVKTVKNMLKSLFKMKDLGELQYFLGLEVNRTTDGIHVSQRKYCTELLKEAGFDECKPAKTPSSVKQVLSAADGDPFLDISKYKHLLGQLQYLTSTRPDISFAVQQLCQFQDSPTSVHYKALQRVFRYLSSSPGQGLFYPKNSAIQLTGYSDSDWATCPDSRRSLTGFCVFLGTSLISWKTKKQSTVSRSSSEAEYRALAQLSCELQWLVRLLSEFGVKHSQPAMVFCDNQSAIHIARNPVFHERTKHIEVDCHVIRERLMNGLIDLKHVSTNFQLADIFTKSLGIDRFNMLMDKLGVSARSSPACGGVTEV